MSNQTHTFKVGDILKVTYRTKRGDDVRTARVTDTTWIEGQVNYGGVYVDGKHLPTGQGAFRPEELGTRKFGLVAVEVIGHRAPMAASRWQPQPGDRGYDLMH